MNIYNNISEEIILDGNSYNIQFLLGSNDPLLMIYALDLLDRMLGKEDVEVFTERNINGEDFAKNIEYCLGSKDSRLKNNAINLLSGMLSIRT